MPDRSPGWPPPSPRANGSASGFDFADGRPDAVTATRRLGHDPAPAPTPVPAPPRPPRVPPWVWDVPRHRYFGIAWKVAAGFVAFGIVAAFVLGKAAKSRTDPAAARKSGTPIPVRTEVVRELDEEMVVGATAVTMPSFSATIRIPPTGGLSVRYVPPVTDMVIKAVLIEEGQFVKKGQELFETDQDFFTQVLEQRKSAVAAGEAQVARAKKQIDLNRQIKEAELAAADAETKFRIKDLENRKQGFDLLSDIQKAGTNSRVEYLDAKSKYESAAYAVEEARRRLDKARDSLDLSVLVDKEDLNRAVRELDLAKVDLEETRGGVARGKITSPIDGFVDSKMDVVPGQTVEVTTPLARVQQLNPIYVKMDFPQERMDDVAEGLPADIALDSFPGESFRGTVLRASAQVSPTLRVFPVLLTLPNPTHRIRSGVTGFARVRKPGKYLVVPETALLRAADKAMCFVVRDGRVRLTEVTPGRPMGVGFVEVRSGLTAGDEVVVYHANFYRHWGNLTKLDAYLQDGDLVDTDWKKWARRDE